MSTMEQWRHSIIWCSFGDKHQNLIKTRHPIAIQNTTVLRKKGLWNASRNKYLMCWGAWAIECKSGEYFIKETWKGAGDRQQWRQGNILIGTLLRTYCWLRRERVPIASDQVHRMLNKSCWKIVHFLSRENSILSHAPQKDFIRQFVACGNMDSKLSTCEVSKCKTNTSCHVRMEMPFWLKNPPSSLSIRHEHPTKAKPKGPVIVVPTANEDVVKIRWKVGI